MEKTIIEPGVPYAMTFGGLEPDQAIRTAAKRLAQAGFERLLVSARAESDAEGLSRELALLALDGCEDVVLVPVDLRLAEGAAALAALDRLYAAIFNCEVRCVAVVTEPPSGCPADLLGFHDVPVGHGARKGAAA